MRLLSSSLSENPAWSWLPIRRVFPAKFDDARNITTAIQHPLNADPLFIREIENQKIRSTDDPKPQGSVTGGPPGMRTSQRMLDKEPRSFPCQLKKSVSRLWALPDGNAGENAIKVASRAGADPGFHLPFSQLPGEFPPPLANPLPNRIGQRKMFAPYSFVDQDIKFVGVRRFIGPQNKQFPAAGNDRRMALKGGVGQSAEGTFRFAETASLHFEPEIDCI
jgi:hypothetical protein